MILPCALDGLLQPVLLNSACCTFYKPSSGKPSFAYENEISVTHLLTDNHTLNCRQDTLLLPRCLVYQKAVTCMCVYRVVLGHRNHVFDPASVFVTLSAH